jgi:N-methylhydantoinase B
LIAPEGTIVNCIRPAPISIATVGTIQIVNNLSTLVLSKMFGASDRYAGRATAVWHGSHAHVETHGLTADGEFFVAPLTDTFCGAAGARAFADGVDLGGEIPNIVSRWANVESQELNTPIRYLFRRAVPDSGGPGKFRGGVCHEYAFAPHGTSGPMGLVLFGKGTRAPMSLGLFGGYPGCNVGYTTFRNGNVDELPDCLEALRGEQRIDQAWGHVELGENDIQYVRFMGGGGYGDPLDRDPELVLRDVRAGLVTEGPARDVYGVVLAGESVDVEATRTRRRELRSERVGRELSPPSERADVPRTGMRLSEYLQRAADGATQCTWCGTEVAPDGADWKDHAAQRRQPLERVGPHRAESGEFFLIESCCPGCATLLDAELAAGSDSHRHDRVHRWPDQKAET